MRGWNGNGRVGAVDASRVGRSAREVAEHASAITRLELELAALEVKRKATALGVGIGLGVGAAVLTLFALGFGLAAAAVAIADVLPMWLSLLVVAAGLFLAAGIAGAVASALLRRGAPPVPEKAIREARLTTTAIRG